MEALQSSQLIIRKQSEEQKDQIVRQQWKGARRQFFQHSIANKLKEAGATQKQQQSVLQLFLKQKYKMGQKLAISHKQLGQLKIYDKQIRQFQQAYNQMEQRFQERLSECQPIRQIIEQNYSTLKLIKIQYTNYSRQVFPLPQYSVSSFELFRVIHNNPLLTEVSIKGVQVKQFQQFIRVMNPSNQSKTVQKQREEHSWVKQLILPKFLKLAIDAQLQFKIEQQKETAQKLEGLTFLHNMVNLSGIKAKIILKKWIRNPIDSRKMFEKLWETLRHLKQIKLIIQGNSDSLIHNELTPIVRSQIFGALTSFTQIIQLDFNGFKFQFQSLNDCLAIQQSLETIFDNNPIIHFRLNCCSRFPILEKANKVNRLQSMNFSYSSFRKNFDFMNQLTHCNNSLLSITHVSGWQQWSIRESLFDNLQSFNILNSEYTFLDNFVQNLPSKIKSLLVCKSQRIDWPLAFSKLFYLRSLSLWYIDCKYDLLSIIPCGNLSKLAIGFNNRFANQDLQQIDSKWPYLSHIQLHKCKEVTEVVWNTCVFRELMQLTVDWDSLGKSKSLQQLQLRGIKVMFD